MSTPESQQLSKENFEQVPSEAAEYSNIHELRHKGRRILGRIALILALVAGGSAALKSETAHATEFVNDYPNLNAAPYNPSVYEWWVDENGNGVADVTPSETDNDESTSSRGYFYRNCTDGASYWTNKYTGVNVAGWGNASTWDSSASSANYTVKSGSANNIEPGDIAQSDDGDWGHVGFVTGVNKDANGAVTSFTAAELNMAGTGAYSFNTYSARNALGKFSRGGLNDWDNFIDVNGANVGLSGDNVNGGGVIAKALPNDFNGDGKSDVALYSETSPNGPVLQVLMSNGTGFEPLTNAYGWGNPTKATTGDFTGDGRTDMLWLEPYGSAYVAQIMQSNGDNFTNAWNNYNWGNPTWMGTGYFDNDNKADVALYYPTSANGPVLQVLRSTGTGFEPLTNAYGWGSPTKAAVGDFTGDGLSDILWLEPSGGAYVAQIMKSNGDSFTNAWNNSGWGNPTWMGVGDFDANGKSDVALFSPHAHYGTVNMIMGSSGTGFSNIWNTFGWGSPTKANVGFYNSDSKSDLLWLEPYSSSYVAQIMSSNGSSGFANAWNNYNWGNPTWMSGGQ